MTASLRGMAFCRHCCSKHRKSHGHILQCGADLTTLLLAIMVERRGVRLWTLESNPRAANAMRSWLAQYELTQAHIILAPADLTKLGVGYAIEGRSAARAVESRRV
ncbi:MAG: hypothetical protein HC809_00680 [Gammaproteobacteria bacterium]|nr:hypothetical protein [Gammaproteobacteria bacterium]